MHSTSELSGGELQFRFLCPPALLRAHAVLDSYQTQHTSWFLILAGAILGITAALLWSAQGSIMMAYPLEKDKGKSFAVFWAIFQFGSFIGSLIALAINIQSGGLSAVATSTYIASRRSLSPPSTC